MNNARFMSSVRRSVRHPLMSRYERLVSLSKLARTAETRAIYQARAALCIRHALRAICTESYVAAGWNRTVTVTR